MAVTGLATSVSCVSEDAGAGVESDAGAREVDSESGELAGFADAGGSAAIGAASLGLEGAGTAWVPPV